jgi:hypothetical protein
VSGMGMTLVTACELLPPRITLGAFGTTKCGEADSFNAASSRTALRPRTYTLSGFAPRPHQRRLVKLRTLEW